jgi:hypothetical protein
MNKSQPAYEYLSADQRSRFATLLGMALDGQFQDSRFFPIMDELACVLTGKNADAYFNEVSGLKFDLKNQRSYYGETCGLIRASRISNEALTRIVLSHLGLDEKTPHGQAALETARLSQEDNIHAYHNAIHSNNVSFLALCAARAAGLPLTDQSLLYIAGQAHDLRHPGQIMPIPPTNEWELHALETFGLQDIQLNARGQAHKVTTRPDSLAVHLDENEKILFAQIVLSTYVGHPGAPDVRAQYAAAAANGAIPRELTLESIMIEADLGESLSRAGNKLLSACFLTEILDTKKRLGITVNSTDTVRARSIYIDNRKSFVDNWVPQTAAFNAMGLTDEARQLSRELA